jgi:hypothetical protein
MSEATCGIIGSERLHQPPLPDIASLIRAAGYGGSRTPIRQQPLRVLALDPLEIIGPELQAGVKLPARPSGVRQRTG